MTRIIIFLFITINLISCPIFSQNKYDALIFPNPSEKIILAKAGSDKSGIIQASQMHSSDTLYQLIFNELDFPFHKSLIKLNQCTRNLANNTEGPNLLLVSNNEGGFAREGIILDGVEYKNLRYVDLVLTPKRIERGEIEIFSHELAHVMMRNIWLNFWETGGDRYAIKQHVSMGVTDYQMAFSEGWAEQFQRLNYEYIDHYKKNEHQTHNFKMSAGKMWHSKLDEKLRIFGTADNRYAFKQILPQGIDTAQLSLEDKIMLLHTSPIFDPSQLRNAQQMLSTEGFISSLFYQINTNEVFQNNYMDKEFYNHFLLNPLSEEIAPDDLFTPLENVILKSYYVWYQLNNKNFDNPICLEFILEWMNQYPEDKDEMIKLFIIQTYGKTFDNSLSDIYQNMAYHGMIGQIQEFRKYSSDFIQEYLKLLERAKEDPKLLCKNIGRELWVRHKTFKVRATLWMPDNKYNFQINLNAANEIELSAFVGSENARQLIDLRNKKGYFSSMEELKNFNLDVDIIQ